MAIQPTLQLLPPGARIVSSSLAIAVEDDRLVAYSGSDCVYTCRSDDRESIRLMMGMFSAMRLAPDRALAAALGTTREAVRRNRYLYQEGGAKAFASRRVGPRQPYKLTADLQLSAQKCLDQGWSVSRTAEEVGLTEGALRYQIRQGRLHRPVGARTADGPAQTDGSQSAALLSPSQRAQEDQACPQGVAVKRVLERAMACTGKLVEAMPEFKAVEAVPGAGVLLAVPALLEQGLIDVGREVFGRLNKAFYGLRDVLMTFAIMGLLRITNPEQLKTRAPGELGLLLGLDRAPEMKCVRRKLREMGRRGLAATLQQRLAERWVEAAPEELGLLYIDGHVRVYNGRTYQLPKHHVQKRGRPMQGTQDFYVNDARAEPLFLVTASATEGLLATIEECLLPEIRNLVADPLRRITIVFDREGWSPERFLRFRDLGFDVLTYRKGRQSVWQQRFFHKVSGIVDGRKVVYQLAERRVKLSNGLPVREVRRLTDSGHQTAVVTTNEELPIFEVAHRMFSRWRQENFFRYMQHEFDLDHMSTYEVEPADPLRLVPHPERKKLAQKIKTAQAAVDKVMGQRVHLAHGQTLRVNRKMLGPIEVDAWIVSREEEIVRLTEARDGLSKVVPLGELLDAGSIVQLERERKMLTDAFKLIAYRAESQMVRWVAPVFKRHEDEARNFLQLIFQATADLLPDMARRTLTVRFHGLASPRATRALAELCTTANAKQVCYPDTDLRLVFEAPECHTSLHT